MQESTNQLLSRKRTIESEDIFAKRYKDEYNAHSGCDNRHAAVPNVDSIVKLEQNDTDVKSELHAPAADQGSSSQSGNSRNYCKERQKELCSEGSLHDHCNSRRHKIKVATLDQLPYHVIAICANSHTKYTRFKTVSFKDKYSKTRYPARSKQSKQLALNTQFNVNYAVVSQVNPHVHVFFHADQGSPGRPVTHLSGRGWRSGFLASTIKIGLMKCCKVLRSQKLLPKTLVFYDLQKFDGNVTILRETDILNWFYTIAYPGKDLLWKLIVSGQLCTWPKITCMMILPQTKLIESEDCLRRRLLPNKL